LVYFPGAGRFIEAHGPTSASLPILFGDYLPHQHLLILLFFGIKKITSSPKTHHFYYKTIAKYQNFTYFCILKSDAAPKQLDLNQLFIDRNDTE